MSAVGVGWVAHMLMNVALGRIPIWLASTLQLGIPVTSTVLVSLFLDEPFALVQGLGMALAIAAMTAMVLRSQRRPAPVVAAPVAEPGASGQPPARAAATPPRSRRPVRGRSGRPVRG